MRLISRKNIHKIDFGQFMDIFVQKWESESS